MKSTPQDKTNLDQILEEEITIPLSTEVAKRRNFAIISHPDAGKTTLTENFYFMAELFNKQGQ